MKGKKMQAIRKEGITLSLFTDEIFCIEKYTKLAGKMLQLRWI
jgi:hypothetical protein